MADRAKALAAETPVRVLKAIPDYLAGKSAYEQLMRPDETGDNRKLHLEKLSFDGLEVWSVPTRRHRWLRLYQSLTCLAYIRSLVRRLPRIDILHLVYPSHISGLGWPIVLVLIGRFFGLKVVLDYSSPLTLSRLAGRSVIVQKIWRLCDLILVPSKYQEQLVNMLGGKARYQHPWVIPSEITPRVISRVQPRLLVATDLEQEHNVGSAIRAFRLVKQKYPRTEMVIVGSGPQRRALERLVGKDGTAGITFAGELSELRRRRLFESSDVYVNCSMVDYLSGATLEAFAQGLPVLTTPLGGGLGMFRDRDNVMQLSYSSSVSLAERIIELVEAPGLVERLSKRSRETALALERDTAGDSRRGLYQELPKR